MVLACCTCNSTTPAERHPADRGAASPRASAVSAAQPPQPPGLASAPASSADVQLPARLTLLTYNVLASRVFAELRTAELLRILERSDADIIALQEVDQWFLDQLGFAPWLARYNVTRRGTQLVAPGGQLLMSRLPVESQRVQVLVGQQRRTALVAQVRIGNRRMAVATAHMESFLQDGATRTQQLADIFELLKLADDAVFMGDMNFGDGEEPETSHVDPNYVDMWLALRNGDAGYTWNIEDNPLARIGAFVGEPSRRLDRVLLRSTVWRPASVRSIGAQPAGRQQLTRALRRQIEMPERSSHAVGEPIIDVFPSDHYGLVAEIAR